MNEEGCGKSGRCIVQVKLTISQESKSHHMDAIQEAGVLSIGMVVIEESKTALDNY